MLFARFRDLSSTSKSLTKGFLCYVFTMFISSVGSKTIGNSNFYCRNGQSDAMFISFLGSEAMGNSNFYCKSGQPDVMHISSVGSETMGNSNFLL